MSRCAALRGRFLRALGCIFPAFRAPNSVLHRVLQVSDGLCWTQWTPRALSLLAMTRNRPTVSCDSLLQNGVPVRQASLPCPSFRTCSHVKVALASNVCAACEHMRCLR